MSETSPLDADEVFVDVDAWQGTACVGVVAAGGERAQVLVGKRVLVGTTDACGECEVCRAGGAPVCLLAKPRIVAPRTRAMGRWLVALGDGLELPLPAAAAVPGDVTLAYTLYARSGVASRDAVIVVGTCPVTRFLVEILRAKGITPTVLAAPGGWADWLLSKGAVVVSPDGDVGPQLRAAIAAQGSSTRPWRVIATSPEAAALASSLGGPRSTLTLRAPVDPIAPRLVAHEILVLGVAREHPDLIVEAAAMCVKGEIDLGAGVTTVTPTERADATRSVVQLAR